MIPPIDDFCLKKSPPEVGGAGIIRYSMVLSYERVDSRSLLDVFSWYRSGTSDISTSSFGVVTKIPWPVTRDAASPHPPGRTWEHGTWLEDDHQVQLYSFF